MRKKILTLGIISALCITNFINPVYASTSPNISLQSWWLVDSGSHLDWKDGGTKYLSNWTSGVSLWNTFMPGVIRKDTSTTVNDLTLSDVSQVNNVNATTYLSGKIIFNQYNMDNLTNSEKTAVAAHECGHALGLDHNTSKDIMYAYTPLVNSLSVNDKASYVATWIKGPYNVPNHGAINCYTINVDNINELVGHADYVFVGKVTKKLSTIEQKTLSGDSIDMPNTIYNVDVIKNLKGNLDTSITITKNGGLNTETNSEIIFEGDEMPQESNTYIFTAYAQPDGSLLVSGKNSNILISKNEGISLLDDTEEYLSYSLAVDQQLNFYLIYPLF